MSIQCYKLQKIFEIGVHRQSFIFSFISQFYKSLDLVENDLLFDHWCRVTMCMLFRVESWLTYKINSNYLCVFILYFIAIHALHHSCLFSTWKHRHFNCQVVPCWTAYWKRHFLLCRYCSVCIVFPDFITCRCDASCNTYVGMSVWVQPIISMNADNT